MDIIAIEKTLLNGLFLPFAIFLELCRIYVLGRIEYPERILHSPHALLSTFCGKANTDESLYYVQGGGTGPFSEQKGQ